MDGSGSNLNPNPNSNFSRNVNRPYNEHLGVNKIGKNIRKSPLHNANFTNPKPHLPPHQQQQQQQQQPQPQVYNISKNDFRSIVQQLTGSPSHHDPLPPPAPVPRYSNNPPRPPSNRLQKIRPPPLTPPIVRPPIHHPPQLPVVHNHNPNPNPNSPFLRPGPFSPLMPGGDSAAHWANTAESPISAYMRYLQNSILDSGSKQVQPGQAQGQLPSPGILPTPPIAPPFPSPRGGSAPLSPALLPSPSSFLNLLSPRSPYPLLSPGFQFPSPLPNFSLSPLAQGSGILGPGPQLPPSPGMFFPSSPSGFLPISNPRWRD